MLLLLSVRAAWARSPRLQRAASLAAMITTSPINRYRIDYWTSTQAMLMLVEARDDSQATQLTPTLTKKRNQSSRSNA
jgi:hypothetical protein